MTENQIVPIPLGTVCSFLIKGEAGGVLVDTGYPGSEGKILDRINKEGLESSQIKLIILTHGHDDHMGSADALRNKTGAKIAVHKQDADKLRSGSNGRMIPVRPVVSVLLGFMIKNFVKPKVNGFEPDILIDDAGFDLKQYGVNGKIIHTPGHTPGSVCVHLDKGDIIVGDLAMAMASNTKPKYPVWAEDISKVRESIKYILGLSPKAIYIAHSYGGPFAPESIKSLL